MTATEMRHKVVSREEWLQARMDLLSAEKELTRRRDELARQRQELPWVRVAKDYVFDGPNGQERLSDLFGDRSQLMVYHFMFGPNWEEGCRSCSFLADHFDAMRIHLRHRDVTLAAVSRAPWQQISAFRKRMGWQFPWVSAFGTDFQSDYGVRFTPAELEEEVTYNYRKMRFGLQDAPGLSVFCKDAAGSIFHTYSAYARGLEALVGTYQVLDLLPKGRDENRLAFSMAWVRHHDQYGDDYAVDSTAWYQHPCVATGECCNHREGSAE